MAGIWDDNDEVWELRAALLVALALQLCDFATHNDVEWSEMKGFFFVFCTYFVLICEEDKLSDLARST